MTTQRGVQVFASQCDTCVFHPGNRMYLKEGRLADIVRSNLATGTALICHKTLPYGDHPEIGQTVCSGWFTRYGSRTASLQIVERLAERSGVEPFDYIEPPPPDHPDRS